MDQHVDRGDEISSGGVRFGSTTLRSEDRPLVTGRGRFTDDIAVLGQAYAAFVRASVAPADIAAIDVAAAAAMPGVLAVITGGDLVAEGIGTIPPVASFN